MRYDGCSSDELWQYSERGDRTAMNVLARRLLPPVRRLGSRYSSCLDDAQGAACELMLDAIASYIPTPGRRLECYVYGYVRRRLARLAAESKTLSLPLDGDDENTTGSDDSLTLADRVAAPDPSPEDQVLQRENNSLVRLVLRQLPDNLRRVLILRYLYGFSNAECAAVLGISMSRIVQLHDQAIRQARRLIA